MRIEILTTPDCPHAGLTVERVREAASRLTPSARVSEIVVGDATAARALSFPGSPTVRIDGEDLEGIAVGPAGLACRRYGEGEGLPPVWLVEARLLRALAPKHVLFLCVANSARSQIAEGIGRSLAPRGVRVSSAGSAPSRVNPNALRVLAELGIDASGQRSKAVDELRAADHAGVDTVITLCAEEVCPVWLGEAHRVHWPLPDPAVVSGTDAEILAAFGEVRDELHRRLGFLFQS